MHKIAIFPFSVRLATALAAALSDEGIAAEAQLMPIPRTNNHNAIHIVVGDKPR
jgi:hypothetical protein